VRNALGLVVLMDNSRPDPLADLALYMNGFSEALRTIPCTVGVGRMETHPVPSLDDYAAGARRRRAGCIRSSSVDVRNSSDVILLLDTLLVQLEADLGRGERVTVSTWPVEDRQPRSRSARHASWSTSWNGVTAAVIATIDGFSVASAVAERRGPRPRGGDGQFDRGDQRAWCPRRRASGRHKSVIVQAESGFAVFCSVYRRDVELVINVLARDSAVLALVAVPGRPSSPGRLHGRVTLEGLTVLHFF
jgi:hypothetical protein